MKIGRPGSSQSKTRDQVFRDARLDLDFAVDGYVRIDGLDLSALSALQRATTGLIRDVRPLFSLYRGDDVELRHKIDRTVRPQLRDLCGSLFASQRFFLGSLLVKFPDPSGALDLHQDWSFVDERRCRSGLVWVPLSGVGESDGALRIVPGTHRLPTVDRGLPREPVPIEPVRRQLERSAVTMPCPLGSALIYDHGLVHGSLPNLGHEPRVVAVVGFAPQQETLIHCGPDEDGAIRRWDVDDHFFEAFEPGSAPPASRVTFSAPARSAENVTRRDLRGLRRLRTQPIGPSADRST